MDTTTTPISPSADGADTAKPVKLVVDDVVEAEKTEQTTEKTEKAEEVEKEAEKEVEGEEDNDEEEEEEKKEELEKKQAKEDQPESTDESDTESEKVEEKAEEKKEEEKTEEEEKKEQEEETQSGPQDTAKDTPEDEDDDNDTPPQVPDKPAVPEKEEKPAVPEKPKPEKALPTIPPIDTIAAAPSAMLSATGLATGRSLPPTMPRSPASFAPSFSPLLCVVDFHHARGPEVEMWFGAAPGEDPAIQYDWPLLPFMALSDGAHASTEDFSYFTLLKPGDKSPKSSLSDKISDTISIAPADYAPSANSYPTSLFGISCTRQIDAAQLLNRPPEVTRSTVQKAVVVIADSPQFFGMLRERLSIVTKAWFDQRDFTDVDILRRFQESLAEEKARGALGGGLIGGGGRLSPSPNANDDEDRDQYLGMSLRELVHEFKWQTLVLLKCCLLQPKMLFFGSRCERLCMMQFSLVSLIPGLLRNLQDCAAPELNAYAEKLKKPTSLRTSDRSSLLTYMGLPLQIFGKGSLFGPYTPLQQLDVLADVGTKSYIVGSTNSLLLQQRDRYSDILINLDEKTISITSTSLRAALQLSVADRRWIDYITQEVNNTWDEANPGRPKTMGYVGSEEFIRLQFEEYLLSLISSVKYHNYTTTVNPRTGRVPVPPLPHIEGDPCVDFGGDFIDYWSKTENYRLWNNNTDTHIFEFVEPKHPCAGGLSMDDVQRRIAQQVQDLHLDERFQQGREVIGRNIAAGREKASTMFNRFYADMETLREAQKKRAEEARQQEASSSNDAASGSSGSANGDAHKSSSSTAGGDSKTQSGQTAGARATAYMSSWASWAGEKRKASGWGRPSSTASGTASADTPPTPTAGAGSSWSLLGRRGNNKDNSSNNSSNGYSVHRNTMSSTASDGSSLRMSGSSFMTGSSDTTNINHTGGNPAAPIGAEDFPPDIIIRNLDEERPARPASTKSVESSVQSVHSSVPAPVVETLHEVSESDVAAAETAEAETTEESPVVQAQPPKTEPTAAVGSKVMLLP